MRALSKDVWCLMCVSQVQILGDKQTTPTLVCHGVDPYWKHPMMFQFNQPRSLHDATITVSVYHNKRFGKVFLGMKYF
jgi:hypothetical protein